MTTDVNKLNDFIQARAKADLEHKVLCFAQELNQALYNLGVSEYSSLSLGTEPNRLRVTVRELPRYIAHAVVGLYGPQYAAKAIANFIDKVDSLEP